METNPKSSGTYTEPWHHPLIAAYHRDIPAIEMALQEAIRNGDGPSAEYAEAEKRRCQIIHLGAMIVDCADKGIKLVPLHHLTYPEIYNEAQAELNLRLTQAGLNEFNIPRNEMRQVSSLHGRYASNVQPGVQFMQVVRNADGEEQYSWKMNTAAGNYTTHYKYLCGPMRCGKVEGDGKCPHTLFCSDKPHEEWQDGVGWKNGNPFQLEHRSGASTV
jgi:hypothetical protein